VPCDSFNDVPVRVINVSHSSAKLASGIIIADLQPVEVVESCLSELPTSLPSEETSAKVRGVTAQLDEEVPEFIQRMINGVHASLPETTILALQSLLVAYQDVFSRSENDLGITDIVEHNIDTGDARPIRQQLRRFPPAHVEAISEHVDNMLSQGVIAACSPWASNIVLVRKKTTRTVAVLIIDSSTQ
jgi:hypothetical protein